ncbi:MULTISPECIES: type II secretion system F family protein [unclassified Rudaea]|uniref:type II secretion system F family protein n=1 Tax=unclassified Rudaea TaxID=2627037 RepID=UPI0010F86648|nr:MULTISPECIES: type II secretion system F family protein [unclassified Rudaea]
MATAATTTRSKPNAADTGRARAQVNQNLTFVWSGTDARGKKLKGEEIAKSAALLKTELRRRGINATAIKPKAKPLFGAAGRTIKPREIAVFSRQIAVMMSAGVPMVQGLDIIGNGQANPRMKNMLLDVKTNIEGGASLAESMRKYPTQFDELYTNLVKAGETAGVLDIVLDTVATYKENIETIKGKVKKALFYPAAVLVVAFIVTLILLIFVIPQFEQVFGNFGAKLPAFTLMYVNLSRFVRDHWLIMIGLIVAVIAGIMFLYKRSPKFAHFIARASLKVPVVGQILTQSAIARFARTLGVTFKAGVPLVEALDSVSTATGSPIYNEAVKKIRGDVAVGHQLQFAMRQTELFPNMVVQMIGIGEEAGALDTMLFKIAEFYEQEVNNAVDALSSLLEPFIMVIIGVIVGGMVVAMYLPIFQLGNVVG